MADDDFFEMPSSSSRVKAEIVKKYFWAWSNVIVNKAYGDRIAYIDLFAGPGIYEDGTKSTPILILESALTEDKRKQKLVTIFNDAKKAHTDSLNEAISKIQGIEKLKYAPVVNNEQIGDKVVEQLKGFTLVPTLLFVDPFGYKGLTIELIASVLKDWGCDCIFFFNYLRVNAAIDNSKFIALIDGLFGKERAAKLRENVSGKSPEKREQIIISAMKSSLKEINGKYVLPFKFYNKDGTRTSHFIFFVSKNPRAYQMMKDIMAPFSTKKTGNVSFFEFNPVPPPKTTQMQLFESIPFDPLVDLAADLTKKYAGKTLSMNDICEDHYVDTFFVKSNYKEVLLTLEKDGNIIANPPVEKRRKILGKPTFGDNVMVTFKNI